MPRTIEIELVDGEVIELTTSMSALLRVEEEFGCKWQEAFNNLSADTDPTNVTKMAAALSGEDVSYISENFDLLALNELGDKITELLGVDAEDLENAGAAKTKKGTRSGGVKGKPRPRKKAPRKKKPG